MIRAAPSVDHIPSAGRRWWQTDAGWVALLNLPAVAMILALILYPVLYSFWISLHRFNLRRPAAVRFVGAENYERIIHDPMFWDAVRVSLTFAAIAVAGVVCTGLVVALLLNLEFRGRG